MGFAQVIVDASAVISVLTNEEDAELMREALLDAVSSRMSAVNWMEVSIRVLRLAEPRLEALFDELIAQANCEVVSVTPDQANIAREAYRRFGKGSGHEAKLNMGDCFAYALATASGEALLFKGDDFARTDIAAALA